MARTFEASRSPSLHTIKPLDDEGSGYSSTITFTAEADYDHT